LKTLDNKEKFKLDWVAYIKYFSLATLEKSKSYNVGFHHKIYG